MSTQHPVVGTLAGLQAQSIVPATAFLTAGQVELRYQISAVTRWRWVRAGAFPAPLKLSGDRVLRWRVADLEAWERARAAARPAQTTGGAP